MLSGTISQTQRAWYPFSSAGHSRRQETVSALFRLTTTHQAHHPPSSPPPTKQTILSLFLTLHNSRTGLFMFLATLGNVCYCHLLGHWEDSCLSYIGPLGNITQKVHLYNGAQTPEASEMLNGLLDSLCLQPCPSPSPALLLPPTHSRNLTPWGTLGRRLSCN